MFQFLRSRPLLGLFTDEYLPQRIPGAAASTIRGYHITLRLLNRFLKRPARLADLNNKTIGRFQAFRIQEDRVALATVSRDIACLRALWSWACRRGMLREWADLAPIGNCQPTPVALSEDDVHRVWQAIQAEKKPIVISCSPLRTVPGSVWFSAIFLLCWDTGERFSAIYNLIEGSLDLENRWVRFPAKTRKGGRVDNAKPISEDCVAAMEKLLALYPRRCYNTRCFRFALNKGLVWRRMANIMKRAGLPDSREFKFHCIRKSVASHLTAAGGDATRMLGHSSPAITEKHYLDPAISHAGVDEAQLAKLFRPGQCG